MSQQPPPQPPGDTLNRGIRTAAQTLVAALVVGLITYLEGIDPTKGLPDLANLKLAAGMILMTALVSLLHNWAESHGWLPAVGKPAPPPAPAPPIPPAAPPR